MAGSLKQRLVVILLGLTLLTWLVSVLLAAHYAGRVMVRHVDQHLSLYSEMARHTMTGVLADPVTQNYFRARSTTLSADATVRRVSSFNQADNGSAVNLWFGESQILVGAHAPKFPSPEAEGFVTWQDEGGSLWRILYGYSPELNVWRATGLDLHAAREGAAAAFWLGLLPLMFILPFTLAVLYLGIRRGLRPLDELAEQISSRKLHALELFDSTHVPSELKPVVVSLNGLLERLQRALVSESRFTANAAHELQTPLAAIRVAIQGCQRQVEGLPDGENVRMMLERISERVSSAADTVKQLLLLARLDPDQQFERESVELEGLVADVMADVGDLAMARDITVRFDDSARTVVQGNAEWLRIMLRNLFSNAFKYSPGGSEVEVTLSRWSDSPQLRIANDCEPLSNHELQRLPERFYHPTTGLDHGAGLGLSIVQRIVELHGAQLTLGRHAEGRGFVAEIQFDAE